MNQLERKIVKEGLKTKNSRKYVREKLELTNSEANLLIDSYQKTKKIIRTGALVLAGLAIGTFYYLTNEQNTEETKSIKPYSGKQFYNTPKEIPSAPNDLELKTANNLIEDAGIGFEYETNMKDLNQKPDVVFIGMVHSQKSQTNTANLINKLARPNETIFVEGLDNYVEKDNALEETITILPPFSTN